MTLQAINTQYHLLNASLTQAITYANVLYLQKSIATLIRDFNTLESSQEVDSSMQALKEKIKNLRDSYRTKIQQLRPTQLSCITSIKAPLRLILNPDHELFSSELLQPQTKLLTKKRDILVTHSVSDNDYQDVPLRQPTYSHQPYVCSLDEQLSPVYYTDGHQELNFSGFIKSVRPK